MNELGIRMIGDVEKVEAANRAACVAGEVHKPIEKPIGIDRGMPAGRLPASGSLAAGTES